MATIKTIADMIGVMKAVYPHFLKDADIKPTATAWAGLFQGVPDEAFIAAFKASLGKCTFPPTPADVTAELKNKYKIGVNVHVEWDQLMGYCKLVNDLRSAFGYTYAPDGGKTQGDQAREDAYNTFYAMPEYLREFIGSPSSLLQYAMEIEDADGIGLQIRRRAYETWRNESIKTVELPELTAGASLVPIHHEPDILDGILY